MQKQRVTITTVDPPTRKLEGRLGDGGVIRIMTWDVSSTFRWPQEDEVWTIYLENGYWMLGSRILNPEEDVPLEDLAPGSVRIDGSTIVDAAGDEVVAVDISTAAEGESIVRRGTGWNTETITGGAGGSDKYFAFHQATPASTWTITHNLGKYPSVTVVDSAGTAINDPYVSYTNANSLALQFDAPFAGDAYLN